MSLYGLRATLLGEVGLTLLGRTVQYHGTVVIDGERYTITGIGAPAAFTTPRGTVPVQAAPVAP